MNDFLKAFGLIVGIILTVIIAPWLLFWVAYFDGWIAKLIIGKHLVAGFALLGLDIPIDKIPLFAACLGWIGGFFKNINLNSNNNK